MELKVLGCWAPYPRMGGACSGYLVTHAGASLLLDCGHGVMSRLPWRDLHGVVISHFHADHWGDLIALRHAWEGQQREGREAEPLPLVVPPGEAVSQLQQMVRAFRVKEVGALADEPGCSYPPITIGPFVIEPFRTLHGFPTIGVAVTAGGRRLVYTGDTGWFDGLPLLAAKADLLLCEASIMERDAEYALKTGHVLARQAGELAVQAGVQRLVLTHFWPGYDLDALRQEAVAAGIEPELAEENLAYRI